MKYIPHRGIFLIFTLASDPADAEKKNIERGYNTIKMLKNTLQQKLSQRFSPSQIQLMNMLALPTVAFEQYLADELESNPALDEITSAQDDYTQDADNAAEQDTDENDYTPEASSDDFDIQDYMFDDEDPDYVPSSSSSDTSGDRNSFIASQSGQESFTAHLLEQLSLENLSERQMTIGRYIIGNIDSDGYLRTDLMSVSDYLAFTASMDVSTEEIKQVLSVIQSFDPPGVGATSLQQCLSIQLSSMAPSPAVDLAKIIVDEAFDDLGQKNFDRLAERLGCTRGQLSDAVNEIARLNPKPGNSYSQNTSSPSQLQVTPDFIIRVEDGAGRNNPGTRQYSPVENIARIFRDARTAGQNGRQNPQGKGYGRIHKKQNRLCPLVYRCRTPKKEHSDADNGIYRPPAKRIPAFRRCVRHAPSGT